LPKGSRPLRRKIQNTTAVDAALKRHSTSPKLL